MRFVWKVSEQTVCFGAVAKLKVTEKFNGILKTKAVNTKRLRQIGEPGDVPH